MIGIILIVLLAGLILHSDNFFASIGDALVAVYKFVTSSWLFIGIVTLFVAVLIGTNVH